MPAEHLVFHLDGDGAAGVGTLDHKLGVAGRCRQRHHALGADLKADRLHRHMACGGLRLGDGVAACGQADNPAGVVACHLGAALRHVIGALPPHLRRNLPRLVARPHGEGLAALARDGQLHAVQRLAVIGIRAHLIKREARGGVHDLVARIALGIRRVEALDGTRLLKRPIDVLDALLIVLRQVHVGVGPGAVFALRPRGLAAVLLVGHALGNAALPRLAVELQLDVGRAVAREVWREPGAVILPSLRSGELGFHKIVLEGVRIDAAFLRCIDDPKHVARFGVGVGGRAVARRIPLRRHLDQAVPVLIALVVVLRQVLELRGGVLIFVCDFHGHDARIVPRTPIALAFKRGAVLGHPFPAVE